MIIAVDGPSGSGKSTVSKRVAMALNLSYIDTGAIYRTLGVIASEKAIDLDDSKALGQLAEHFPISFRFESGVNHVYFEDRDVTSIIRTPKASENASKVSKAPDVRAALLGLQRELGAKSDSILDGRDIGTVIFPHADFKFYIEATVEERARRRYEELNNKGLSVRFEDVARDIKKRDDQDMNRDVAPLKRADDAILIETTGISIDDVVEQIIQTIKA